MIEYSWKPLLAAVAVVVQAGLELREKTQLTDSRQKIALTSVQPINTQSLYINSMPDLTFCSFTDNVSLCPSIMFYIPRILGDMDHMDHHITLTADRFQVYLRRQRRHL